MAEITRPDRQQEAAAVAVPADRAVQIPEQLAALVVLQKHRRLPAHLYIILVAVPAVRGITEEHSDLTASVIHAAVMVWAENLLAPIMTVQTE